MRRAWLTLVLLALACGGPSSAGQERATSGDEATDEGSADERVVDPAAVAAVRAGADDEVPRLVLRPMEEVAEAEDGEGHLVGASHAVAFELDARLVPTRSGDADPLRLRVGDLVLHRMEIARPGILRFILADRDRVPEGAAVSIQYGDDESTRVLVDPVLHIPWGPSE